MAMTNAQRQKKWRNANRALFNLRRRNARKDLSGGVESGHALSEGRHGVQVPLSDNEHELSSTASGSIAPPAQNNLPVATLPYEPPTVQSVGSASVVNKTFTPDEELQNIIAQNSVIKNGLPAMSPPWENREDSERDVQMLCNALALFCKAPVYKSRVRNALREAKIIK